MLIFAWIAFGVIAGLLASRLFRHTAGALALDVGLSVAGAIGGAFAMNSLGLPQPTPFLVAGLLGAAAGSVGILIAYRSIFRRA